MGQAGAEQGDDRLDPGDPDARLAEVDLGLGARVVGERDGDPAQAGPAVVADPRPDGRLATGEAVFGDEALPDPPRGVALFVVDRLVGHQPGLDDVGDLIHDRGRPPSRPAVRPGTGIVEGAADRRPAVMEGAGELADARPFPEVGVPDTLDVDHLDQPFLQDGCGVEHRHRTGWLEGQGGPALADHSPPGCVNFTLSLAHVPVCFCERASPWQRGTNENTNGLLRQYFPKGTDLGVHTAERLATVAADLNARPRKTLGWETPYQQLDRLLASGP